MQEKIFTNMSKQAVELLKEDMEFMGPVLRKQIYAAREEIVKIDPELKYHDVRMVPGDTHTNLIFDVVKPYSCFLTDEQLKLAIHNAVHSRAPDVFCAITVDQPFVK